MPQLAFDTYAPQLIWLVISFTLLYLLMSRIALPRIGGVIEARRDKIANDLDRAAESKKDAEDALAAYDKSLAEARSRAVSIATKNRQKVKDETDKLRSDTETKISAMMQEAETRIQATKDAALANVRGVAVETTGVVVEKLLGQTPDLASVQKAVDQELQ